MRFRNRKKASPVGAGRSDRLGVGWRVLGGVGDGCLVASAMSGLALSYEAVRDRAAAYVGALSYAVPIAVDVLVLGALARYVSDRRSGRSGRGWQVIAWAGLAASIALNAAGRGPADAGWHLIGPVALGAVSEAYARRAAALHRAEQVPVGPGIPGRLWVTSPVASARLAVRMARSGTRDARVARGEAGREAAARQALRAACRGPAYARTRRVALAQLRAGTLAPEAVLDVLGWSGPPGPADPDEALRRVLCQALTGHPAPAGAGTAPDPPRSQALRAVGAVAGPGRDVESVEDRPPVGTGGPRRRPGDTARPAGTGSRVARLRARDPGLSTVEIARRLGVSDRTVRRHLSDTTPDTGADNRPDTGTDSTSDALTDRDPGAVSAPGPDNRADSPADIVSGLRPDTTPDGPGGTVSGSFPDTGADVLSAPVSDLTPDGAPDAGADVVSGPVSVVSGGRVPALAGGTS